MEPDAALFVLARARLPDAALAEAAAEQMARGCQAGTLPPFIGIRIKPMSPELHARSLRTLDIFVSTLARTNRRTLPSHRT